MKPIAAELGIRQKVQERPELKARLTDRLHGRSLKVPNGQDGTVTLRVNTLRRSWLRDRDPETGVKNRKRSLVFLGDYNDDDARMRVTPALEKQIPEKRYRETIHVDVDRYATLSGSYELAEASVYSLDPSKTLVYYNIAPRGADNGHDENHKAVKWNGEKRQGLIFGITDRGVPIVGVNSSHNFSLVKDHLIGAWEVDFSHDPHLAQLLNDTQFRSLYVYPSALAILRGRKGRKFIGRELNIEEEIPDAPKPTYDKATGELTAHVLFVDGRKSQRGYHNLKLLLTPQDLPDEIRNSPWLLGTVNGVTQLFVNNLAPEHKDLDTKDFFLTEGSSGDPKNHWLEANRYYYPSADVFNLDGVTDKTTITFKPVPEGELEEWRVKDKEARELAKV
jgi:hypothetical protein